MDIYVVSTKGSGKTELAAFDNALKNAGVYNFNLIALSSIVPPKANVVKEAFVHENYGKVGDRLYVVKAEMRGCDHNEYIGAAVGWYIFGEEGGVFVEHETKGKSEDEVRNKLKSDVETSISELCKFRKKEFNKEKLGTSFSVSRVGDLPTCVLTLAVYKAEPW